MSPTTNMHVGGESDGCIVPMKCPNNGGQPPAEDAEGRQPTKENIVQATAPRTQSRTGELSDLRGVRKAAREGKRTRFTALLHHVTVGLLRDSFYALKREAAPGVDGLTWKEYETELEPRLADLHSRVHLGTYRAQPSKRAYIPKGDGRQRPLASLLWRTKSFNKPWRQSSIRSMRRIFWGSLMVSVRGEASIRRWTRSGWESCGRR